jgi:hypothetical protein
MSAEFSPKITLHGDALEKRVRANVKRRVEDQHSLVHPLGPVVLAHLDELPMDWNTARSRGEINTFLPSTIRALYYARSMTGRPLKYAELEERTPEQRWDIVKSSLDDPAVQRIFKDKLW